MLRVPRIETSFETVTSPCPTCEGEISISIESILPIVIIPVDCLSSSDKIPETFKILGGVVKFVLVMITLKSLESLNTVHSKNLFQIW